MPTIVDSGTKGNLVTANTPAGRAPDPTPRRFLTFLTDAGSVHTIVVDVDHAAQDAETLLQWFLHTRVGVELSASNPTSPFHKTVDEVVKYADEAVGLVKSTADALGGSQPTSEVGGVN